MLIHNNLQITDLRLKEELRWTSSKVVVVDSFNHDVSHRILSNPNLQSMVQGGHVGT